MTHPLPRPRMAPFPDDVLSLIFYFVHSDQLSAWKLISADGSKATEGPVSATFSALMQVNSVFHALASKYAVRAVHRPDVIHRRPDNTRRKELVAKNTRSVILSDHNAAVCQAYPDHELQGATNVESLVVHNYWDQRKGVWRCIHHGVTEHQACGFLTTLRPRKLVVHSSSAIFPRVYEEQVIPASALASITTHVYLINDTNVLVGLDGRKKPFMGGVGRLTPARAAKLSNIVLVFAVENPTDTWHVKHRSEALAEGGWAWDALDALARFIATVPPSCKLTIVHSGAIDVVGGYNEFSWCPALRQKTLETIFRPRVTHHFKKNRCCAWFRALLSDRTRQREKSLLADRHDAIQFLSMKDYILNEDWVDVLDPAFARRFLHTAVGPPIPPVE